MKVAPCVPTGWTSLSALVIRMWPVIPASSSRLRQRPTIPAEAPYPCELAQRKRKPGRPVDWMGLMGAQRTAPRSTSALESSSISARRSLQSDGSFSSAASQASASERSDCSGSGRGPEDLAELEPSDDSFLVDPPQKSPHGFGSDPVPPGRDGEADLLVPDARPGRPEQRSGAGSGRVVVDREAQRDLGPPWIQGAFDVVPAVDQRHGGTVHSGPWRRSNSAQTCPKPTSRTCCGRCS